MSFDDDDDDDDAAAAAAAAAAAVAVAAAAADDDDNDGDGEIFRCILGFVMESDARLASRVRKKLEEENICEKRLKVCSIVIPVHTQHE